MSYFDAIDKAIELTVVTDELTAVSYLEPSYRMLLRDNDIHLPGYDPITNDNDSELWEILHLEVEKRNAMLNFVEPVAGWIYSMIANTAEPVLTQEENDLLKNLTEYLQAKNGKRQRIKKKKINEKEDTQT